MALASDDKLAIQTHLIYRALSHAHRVCSLSAELGIGGPRRGGLQPGVDGEL